jgi:hypothetical protein
MNYRFTARQILRKHLETWPNSKSPFYKRDFKWLYIRKDILTKHKTNISLLVDQEGVGSVKNLA